MTLKQKIEHYAGVAGKLQKDIAELAMDDTAPVHFHEILALGDAWRAAEQAQQHLMTLAFRVNR